MQSVNVVVYVPTRGTLKSLMTVIARRFPCNLGIIEGLPRNKNFPLRSTRTRSTCTISALVLDGNGLDYRDGDAIMMITALVHGPRGYFSRHPVKSYTGASDYDINRSRLHCPGLIADNGIVEQCARYHCTRWDLTLSRPTEHLERMKFGIVVVGNQID